MDTDDSGPQRRRHTPSHGNISLAKLRFETQILSGYYMGPTLRSFIAPGHEKEFDYCSFEANYFGDVSLQVAHRVDQILIDWITQKETPERCISRLNSVIEDMKASDVPTERQQMTEACVQALESLANESLPNPETRTLAESLVKYLRDAWIPVARHIPGKGTLGLG